jgi:hypothetical protein
VLTAFVTERYGWTALFATLVFVSILSICALLPALLSELKSLQIDRDDEELQEHLADTTDHDQDHLSDVVDKLPLARAFEVTNSRSE